MNLNGLDCEGLFRVLAEHGHEDVVHYFSLGLVRRCYIDEDVAGFGADFRVVGIYYWRHRADCSVGVEDDRVDW